MYETETKRETVVTSGRSGGKTVKRLGELSPGERGVISDLLCRGKLRRRFMDMGLVRGTPFTVERVAPLGDPMEVKIKGFCLSLRKEEAQDILVELDEDG